MGTCSSNHSQSMLSHPTLGALKHDAISMKLSIFLPHESAYFHLTKTIHRLRYASEVRDHLYLPLSQKLQCDPLSCNQTAAALLTFPPYFQTMEDVIQKRQVTTELQLMRILRATIACTKYFQRHAIPQEGLCPVNILVMSDQKIKIIFKQMVSTSQYEITEAEEEEESKESHKQRIGIVLLAIASLSTHGTFFEKDNSLKKKIDEQLVNLLLKQSGSRYSDSTIQIMRELIYEKKSSIADILKRIEKHGQTDKEEPTADSSKDIENKDIENERTSSVWPVVPERKISPVRRAASKIAVTCESIL